MSDIEQLTETEYHDWKQISLSLVSKNLREQAEQIIEIIDKHRTVLYR